MQIGDARFFFSDCFQWAPALFKTQAAATIFVPKGGNQPDCRHRPNTHCKLSRFFCILGIFFHGNFSQISKGIKIHLFRIWINVEDGFVDSFLRPNFDVCLQPESGKHTTSYYHFVPWCHVVPCCFAWDGVDWLRIPMHRITSLIPLSFSFPLAPWLFEVIISHI